MVDWVPGKPLGFAKASTNSTSFTTLRRLPVFFWPGMFILAVAVVGFVLTKVSDRVTWEMLLRDPAATLHGSPFTGLISHTGVIVMIAAGVVCLFTTSLLKQWPLALMGAGAFSIVFGMDDLTMAHETVLPEFLGLPEIVVYAGYGVAMVAILLSQLPYRNRPSTLLLFLVPVFFGLSVVLDQIPLLPMTVNTEMVLEDFAKLSGIVCWAAYWTAYSRRRLAEEAQR